MAASTWQFYHSFKEYMADNTVDLDTHNFRLALFLSTSNFATKTLTTYSQLTNEVANANGYTTGGKALANITWVSGRSAAEMRWDATALIFTASGGTIVNIKGAVIYQSAGKLVAYSTLTTTGNIDITDGNTLTLTMAANGIFQLA